MATRPPMSTRPLTPSPMPRDAQCTQLESQDSPITMVHVPRQWSNHFQLKTSCPRNKACGGKDANRARDCQRVGQQLPAVKFSPISTIGNPRHVDLEIQS